MKNLLVLSYLLSLTSLAASNGELKDQFEALKETVNALEDRAQFGDNAHLNLPSLDLGKIRGVYAYFSNFDRQKLNNLQKYVPRIYAASLAVLETYPNNLINLEGKRSQHLENRFEKNFYERLVEKYNALRAAELTDNFLLIKETKTYEFVAQGACSRQQEVYGTIIKRFQLVVNEYYDRLHCLYNGDLSELENLKAIERYAVYFGNFPVAVLQQRIKLLNRKLIGRPDNEINQLLHGLKRVGYTVKCPSSVIRNTT